MDVSLPPELERFIHSQVESGKYASVADVFLAGIQSLEERERIYKGRFEELRQQALIGVEQLDRGEVGEGKIVFQQLQEKLQQRRAQAGQ